MNGFLKCFMNSTGNPVFNQGFYEYIHGNSHDYIREIPMY